MDKHYIGDRWWSPFAEMSEWVKVSVLKIDEQVCSEGSNPSLSVPRGGYMNKYSIPEKYRYMCRSTSKGNQTKYYKDGYFYKLGLHEAVCEELASKVLKYSSLNTNCWVRYERCFVNDKYACRSHSFLSENEEFIPVESLYKKLTGNGSLSGKLNYLRNAKDRLLFILNFIRSATGIMNYDVYLKSMMLLDMLILNNDRHTYNYGVVYNCITGKFRIPPIFDNGSSLEYGKASCTLSGSYEEQVVAFGYPIKSTLKIDYSRLNRSLSHYHNCMEVNVLKSQLKKYEGIFNV